MEGTREGREGQGESTQRGRKRLVIWETSGLCSCEQSSPTGEQSRSLELGYYRLVGPCVWKCTCCRAGLQLWRDSGGGVGFFGSLSVSCQSVWDLHSTHSYDSLLFNISECFCSPLKHLHVFSLILYLPFHSSYLLFRLLTTIIMLSPPPHTSSFTPPSFKHWWAAEQYPGGHGDRQPPPSCSLPAIVPRPTAA